MAPARLLLCLFLAQTASAQERGRVLEQVPLESGLSQSTISAIVQDSRGFLWIGTGEGLDRYDGYQFVTYRHDPRNSASLPDDKVCSLFEDRQQNLWVGTVGGTARLDQRTGGFVQVLTANGESTVRERVKCAWHILEDRAGTFWQATNTGVERFDRDQLRARAYSATQPARRLYEDSAGTVWAFGDRLTVAWRYDRAHDQFVRAEIRDVDPWHIESLEGILRRPDLVWGVGSSALSLLDLQRRELRRIVDAPDAWFATSDPDGGLWFAGTSITGYSFKTGAWRTYQIDSSGANALNGVRTLYRDRSGTLWVGTLGGLYRLDPHTRRFSHRANDPSTKDSLSSNIIGAIQEDADGTLWVGTIGGGLNRVDRRAGRVTRFRHNPRDRSSLSDDVVWAIHEQRGRLFIGTDRGLDILDPATGRFRSVRCDPAETRSSFPNAVTSIVSGGPDLLWLGMYGAGLGKFDIRTSACRVVTRVAPGEVDVGGAALHVDRDGAIWLGIDGAGLRRYDPATGRLTSFGGDRHTGLSARVVWTIHPTADGALWLGTDTGLVRFDPSTGAFNQVWDRSLPSSVVYSIVEDDHARLWVSTNRGLCYYDPHAPAGRQFKSFGTEDGLRNTEFNRRAALRTRSGELFFGGLLGLTSFKPDDIVRSNPIVPPVVLTELETRTRSGVRTTDPAGLDQVVLSHTDYSFSFSFVALNFTNARKNQYSYRLEGFDPDWVDASSQRVARYTNVPPGTYTFRVRGSNNDGVWNEEGASLRVVITPPYWQRWWFRTLAIGALGGLLVLAHRSRVRHILALERIRTQVATDLHDEVGSGLSQVAILSEVAKRDAPPAAAALMHETATLARQMRESMGDIVWAVDPRRDRLADLVSRMRQVAVNALEADGVRVELQLPADDEIERIGLPSDRRRQLLLIFKEAVTNVARHAEASHVRVDLAVHGGALRLAVRDNGRGFDPNRVARGQGLDSLNRRTAELHGHLTVDSRPGHGTFVELQVPLK